jgi:hypothetical protein
MRGSSADYMLAIFSRAALLAQTQSIAVISASPAYFRCFRPNPNRSGTKVIS